MIMKIDLNQVSSIIEALEKIMPNSEITVDANGNKIKISIVRN